MYHTWVNQYHPKTKKALREAIKNGEDVYILDTSMVPQYSGPIQGCPEGVRLVIVGPHCYDRRWYANIIRTGDRIKFE